MGRGGKLLQLSLKLITWMHRTKLFEGQTSIQMRHECCQQELCSDILFSRHLAQDTKRKALCKFIPYVCLLNM